MVPRNSLLRTDIAEDIQLVLVLSAHTFFSSGCVVETTEFSGTASALYSLRMTIKTLHIVDGESTGGSLRQAGFGKKGDRGVGAMRSTLDQFLLA
jgi:hypothetical protein